MRSFALLLGMLPLIPITVAQGPPPTILEITVENLTTYEDDDVEFLRLATDPNRTSVPALKNFVRFIAIGDVVSVNGDPAKGTFTQRGQRFGLNVAPPPGQAMADIPRGAMNDYFVEILHPDGKAIGTIVALGMGGLGAPPGAPVSSFALNYTVVGGTGAYLGARGQWGQRQGGTPIRGASMSEDPANRRLHGGGISHFLVHLIPMNRPEVVVTSNTPSVFHADFTPVTNSRPASPGEALVLLATGLGPTRPGVDPGAPFPASPLHAASSPVHVIVNGVSVEAQYAGGYPGATDVYQVNFRLPPEVPAGMTTLRLSVAWISGSQVTVPVR